VRVLWASYAREAPLPPWQSYQGTLSSLLAEWGMARRTPEEMASFCDSAGATRWALDFVGAEKWWLRAEAAELLGLLPATPASVAALRRMTTDAEARVRANAAHALGNLGPAAHDALPDLAKAFADGDWFVRASSTIALRAVHAR
jgi:hypothetical protein